MQVSLADLSKYLGKEAPFLARLTLQGVIEKDENGLYDLEKSKEQVTARLEKFRVAKVVTNRSVPEARSLLNGSEPVEEESQNKTYWTAKTRSEAAKAVMAELEYRERCAALVEADEIEREIQASFRMVRDRLNAIPDRLAHTISAISDPEECRATLKKEIRQALEVLASE